ncbi:MAG TPA: DUF6364 family protein [Bacteroidales bacterium]|nr:DUF6364 family protein [Bacteroidales bacterium]
MNSKLTLKLDQETIELAKEYAKDKNTSLSKMIENYLRLIVRRKRHDIGISPLVESLSGIIKGKNTKMEKEYVDYLSTKYK